MSQQEPLARSGAPRAGRPTGLLRCCAALALLSAGPECPALERIVLQIGEISYSGMKASDVRATLDVAAAGQSRKSGDERARVASARVAAAAAPARTATLITPSARVQAARLSLDGALASYTAVDVTCTNVVVAEPEYGCRGFSLAARGGPVGAIDLSGSAMYETQHAAFSFTAMSNVPIAGGNARVSGEVCSAASHVVVDASRIDLVKAAPLVSRWVKAPEGYSFAGHADAHTELRIGAAEHGCSSSIGPLPVGHSPLRQWSVGQPSAARAAAVQASAAQPPPGPNLSVNATVKLTDLNFSNQAGTVVGEKLAPSLTGTLVRTGPTFSVSTELTSQRGQTLAGPVLLDFGANPLTLRGQGVFDPASGGMLKIASLDVMQKDLIDAHAQGEITLPTTLSHVNLDVHSLTLPAAYTSFMQLTLATTDFGALTTRGHASGTVEVNNGAVSRLDAQLESVDLEDPNTQFMMHKLAGDIHWAAAPDATVQTSHLSWTGSSGYGLRGGAAQLAFTTRERGFSLIGDTRLPLFDGAVLIHKLAGRQLGAEKPEVDFDAEIEPISMRLLSKAFGWPELSGQLAGRIPGVTYRDRVLAVDGDIVANVFNGTVVGSQFRLQDPLGRWPRLYADVTARGLDLDLVTHTFAIGSITGLLNVDIRGLELFNWSPVAFDARLYTPPGDSSKHLISQKAITSISNVGGGGGSVVAALQSGLLRFFDTFHYDRIGISCQLRDELCLMAGIEPAPKGGYYLVKGSGLPRIDIIGNSGRVDWPQLMSQIVAGMRSQNVVVH